MKEILIAVGSGFMLFLFYWFLLKDEWNEKALKKKQEKIETDKYAFSITNQSSHVNNKVLETQMNDSGIYPDWGEGPESADELLPGHKL